MDQVELHLMHCSMQFSDTRAQQLADAQKIFDRAAKRKVHWLTGTEAGATRDNDNRELLKQAATEHHYTFSAKKGNDSWVAVRRNLVSAEYDVDYYEVITASEGVGHHAARGPLVVSFDPSVPIGRTNVISMHLLTKGRMPGDPNYRLNQKMLAAVGELAKKRGKQRAKVFYGGDQNIVDRHGDTFLGQPLTSAWDELKKWEATGHGNIDVIASYDYDRSVSARYCRALDDREFHLHSDHYLVEAGFTVQIR